MVSWERLSGTDLSMLWPDELGWPQDIGAIILLDGTHLLDDEGNLPIDEVRDHVGGRLGLVPRFCQRLQRTRWWEGRPIWVDVPVDIEYHVRTRRLPAPGGERQLLDTCEEIRFRRFDPGRPRWEFWFLTGFPDREVAVLVKVHHALADGAAGLAALTAFFDLAPDASVPSSPQRDPGPGPTARELVLDHLRQAGRRLRSASAALTRPFSLLARLGQAWRAIRQIMGEGHAPRTSINRPIGAHRRLALVRGDLDTVKEIAHSRDATVNDVLFAAIGGGLAELFASREETLESPPRAVAPVGGGAEGGSGNATTGSLLATLPMQVPSPLHRLEVIADETRRRKQNLLSYEEAGIFSSPLLERLAARFAGRQRMANVVVSNLVGSPVPLHFGRAPVLEMFSLVALVGNVAIGVGALSYAGRLNLTVVADRDACPDLDRFVAGLSGSLSEMEAGVRQEQMVRRGGP